MNLKKKLHDNTAVEGPLKASDPVQFQVNPELGEGGHNWLLIIYVLFNKPLDYFQIVNLIRNSEKVGNSLIQIKRSNYMS